MEMAEILMKAAAFVAIIFMGYGLRRVGFFNGRTFICSPRLCLRSHFRRRL